MLKINEIFYSIQGESSYAGSPTVFLRTTGCNLRCNYCDTKYSYHEGHYASIQDTLDKIQSYKSKYVCVTGGEPLLQPEIFPLMSQLCDLGYKVSLETSGSKSIQNVDPRVKIILDVKTPDSDEGDSFLLENLHYINSSTEVKFVICSEKDFEWSENFCGQHDLFKKCLVLYSPAHQILEAQWLAKEMLRNNSSARLQLQQHKYIWSPETRGV